MPERWQLEVKKLDGLEMPATVRERMERGPRGDRLPPRRDRVLAAVVAFAVFAAAGFLVWTAFRPTRAVVGGESTPQVVVTFTTTGPDSELPTAILVLGDETVKGAPGSYCWNGTTKCVDTVAPEFTDFLVVPRGTELVVRGTAESVDGSLGKTWDQPGVKLDLADGSTTLDAKPSKYVLSFVAYWPQGDVPFFFPIEIVPRTEVSSPSPGAEGLDATYSGPLGWSMRYPAGWHLTEFENVCRAGFTGALIANVPDAYRSPVSENGCYWPPRMSLLPPTGVVVEFDLMGGGPFSDTTPTTPDTTFPLSFDDLQVEPTPGPGPVMYSEQVQVNGNARYHLNVWIGPEASAEDQEIARQIVSSIAFNPSSATPSAVASETPTPTETGVAHPGTIALTWSHGSMPGVTLPRSGAVFVSPTRLAFVTTGSGSCPSLPIALEVLGPSEIQMQLTMYDPDNEPCTADFGPTTVEIAIDPA